MRTQSKNSVPDFVLLPIPYPLHALEPYISRATLELHYCKHHRTYSWYNLNSLLLGSDFDGLSLTDIVGRSTGALFNNAAQVWNHNFYWQCMSPEGGGAPAGELARKLIDTFGSVSKFKDSFKNKAVDKFGSGWTWLVRTQDHRLMLLNTHDADNPLRLVAQPLLTCDVWEHAYYLDYRNDRARYIDAFWNVLNWRFVEENFAQSQFGNVYNWLPGGKTAQR